MYKITNSGILKVQDGIVIASIPEDEKNRDWQQYLAWLDAGNTPEPADGPDVAALQTAALAALEDGIYQAALVITNEPSIDALKIAEWTVKEAAWAGWIAAGQPVPDAGNEFGWVIGEAEQYMADPASGITSASDLLALWGVKATAWRKLQKEVIPAFRQAQKKAIAAAEAETLAEMTMEYFEAALLAAVAG